MEAHFHHKGKYTASEFTVDEVVASLIAQKEIIEAGLAFLSELDPRFRYDAAKIRVESITTGTLAWDLLVQVYGEFQTEIEDRVVGTLEAMFGTDIPQELEGIVTLAALAVTYMVARFAYERVMRAKSSDQPSIHINGENNVVIQQIAQAIGGDQEHVVRALERSLPLPKRTRLISGVADFLRPSKKEPGEKIELDNAPDIPAEALAEFPSDADLENIQGGKNIDLPSARIDIRRLDRDMGSTGWAAMIVDDPRFPKRLPMDLYPTVSPEALAKHQEVTADLLIECDLDAQGVQKPRRIHLLSFRDPDAAPESK